MTNVSTYLVNFCHDNICMQTTYAYLFNAFGPETIIWDFNNRTEDNNNKSEIARG